jgi:hypothetical protein
LLPVAIVVVAMRCAKAFIERGIEWKHFQHTTVGCLNVIQMKKAWI